MMGGVGVRLAAGRRAAVIAVVCMAAVSPGTQAAEVRLHLPLGRTAYQTNEWIDVAVVRDVPGPVRLSLCCADGNNIEATFADRTHPPLRGQRTGHYRIDARLLRPGRYTLHAHCADVSSQPLELLIVSHLRKSEFKLSNWGRARGAQQLSQGEDSLGYNLAYAAYSRDETDGFLRAGMDFMPTCTLSGGHQMDLRLECDWSDPLVLRGAGQRGTRRAFTDRTRGNTLGVHLYDEPGLTWHHHPVTGEFTPHGVPAQVRSYLRAYGEQPIA